MVTYLINRLLNNLHPAINKDPQSSPAITINGIGNVIIKNDILQILGTNSAQFNLRGYTLGSLTTAINQISGFTATCLAPVNLGASVLIEGTYATPNTINLFNSFLWQILKPVAIALLDALDAERRSMQEMIINSSGGAWIDSFGETFGVYRESGEPDSLYATRVFNLSVGVRVNNLAIQKALQDVSYITDVTDSPNVNNQGPGFVLHATIPINVADGFVYSNEQIFNVIDQIRPAGVPWAILSQGSASDTITISESVTLTINSNLKYGGSRKWGQLIWN